VTTNPGVPVKPESSDPASPVLADSHATQPAIDPAQLSRPAHSPIHRWLEALALAGFALLCTVLGVMLILLPWTLQWTDNPLLWTHPDVRTFLGYGFVRGVCSGLGLLDLWLGVREVSHYFERMSRSR
jgi:hypothetical protein